MVWRACKRQFGGLSVGLSVGPRRSRYIYLTHLGLSQEHLHQLIPSHHLPEHGEPRVLSRVDERRPIHHHEAHGLCVGEEVDAELDLDAIEDVGWRSGVHGVDDYFGHFGR